MIEHSGLSTPIYQELKRMILTQELKPGEKILQEKIAEKLGVSRTPMMKALQLLESEMLVESIPRRGFYVKVFNVQELIDVYDCREVLEGMAARRLAERQDLSTLSKLEKCFSGFDASEGIDQKKYARADGDFHKLLIDLVGNQALNKIYFISNIYSEVVRKGLLRTPEETLAEHWAIIEAIRSGDGSAAEAAARAHIARSRDTLMTQLNSSGNHD
ncbi:GntR family transcriptional regulator [Marinoscillum furvescens]|uniref:GntR family transcriptional regulator n=1 Tax=Marinoscillum furvescens DSM 4134 TaxID=1122208 RepID=A0A3D9L6T0_MARFU|nr:GntR family transcriptional regulator [Marinoscillum furvescens]REE01184.1 GntR family transcriptional regulator [Marinoscillum furvescens DSM 4134]